MSKLYDVQNTLKTSLVANVTALTVDNVIVDRQKDIDSEVTSAIRKSNGIACLIGSTNAEVEDPDIPGPRLTVTLTLLLFFRPIISDVTNDLADEVLEDVLQHVHKLTNTARPHMCEEFKVLSYSLVSDPDYLVYSIEVETIIQL